MKLSTYLKSGALTLLLLFMSGQSFAYSSCFNDPEVRDRYRALLGDLRCMKCANQSLLDSPADVADDMRNKVCKQVLGGMSDTDIKDYFAARYQERVIFTPRGWFWIVLPFLGLVIAALVLFGRRRSGHTKKTTPDRAGEPPMTVHESSVVTSQLLGEPTAEANSNRTNAEKPNGDEGADS